MDIAQHQLASVIEQSIEFTRAAERIQELQAHVDTLTQRLLAAASDRDKAEAALIEQARQHEVRALLPAPVDVGARCMMHLYRPLITEAHTC